MLHGRSSSDYCKRRSWLSEPRFWNMSTVSEYPLLASRILLTILPTQGTKATVGTFNFFFGDNKLVLCLTRR